MAACANSLALRDHQAEQVKRQRNAAEWATAFDAALSRFSEELGDDMLLEVVGELGENDPDFDHQTTLAFQALSRVRARRTGHDQLTFHYAAIGRIVADWIDHYRRQWAEREADLETGS